MLTFANIIIHIIEGMAITASIYLVTKKSLNIKEMCILAATITTTFLVLDLFAPGVASGARQGSGFGLGYTQFAGMPTPLPRSYFEPKSQENIVEGMDDPTAIDYYSKINPPEKDNTTKSGTVCEPTLIIENENKIPSIILGEYTKNPFDTTSKYASYPN